MRRLMTILMGLILAGAMACVSSDADEESADPGETGMNLLIDLQKQSDVEAIRYTLSECGSTEVVAEETKELKDMTFPVGSGGFFDAVFQEFSEHIFADYFVHLDVGCYDVHVEPLRPSGDKSRDCLPVTKRAIEVAKGKTTEVVMVSQCKGKDKGAVDVISALNHPPQLEFVDLAPKTFIRCPEEGPPHVVICVQAQDSDGDPMVFDWSPLRDREGIKDDVELELVEDSDHIIGGLAGECVQAELERQDAEYKGKVTVFDQFVIFDNDEPELITAEDWFAEQGITDKDGNPVRSRSSRKFSVCVTDCDKELICPRTQGYWKTPPHDEEAIAAKWEDTDFTLDEALCEGEEAEKWIDILPPGPTGLYYRLATQYIAAMLNISAGATVVGDIEDDLQTAQQLLERPAICADKSSIQAVESVDDTIVIVEALKDRIEGYNQLCAGGS